MPNIAVVSTVFNVFFSYAHFGMLPFKQSCGLQPGVASLTNNSTTTKNHETYWVSGDIVCFCHVSEEEWERRGGKGEGEDR